MEQSQQDGWLNSTLQKTTAHRANKRKKMDNTRFQSTKHFERYNQFYEKASIIQ